MLRFENVTKRYGDATVFTGLTYHFEPGCFALQGDHGTGKSTLINILAGALPADAGEVWIGVHSLQRAQPSATANLAYVPDDGLLYPDITGRELFRRAALAREATLLQDTLDLADRFGLTSRLDIPFEQMSTGTRKKVFLTAISIGAPPVILVDEPTTGLDMPSRQLLAQFFRTLSQTRVILFATHDADFATACGARIIGFDELKAAPSVIQNP